MDKISSIAYVMYHTSNNQDIKQMAINLLNGDVTLRELKRNSQFSSAITAAEKYMKQHDIVNSEIVQFISKFMTVEA
jgi:hypothetical protein